MKRTDINTGAVYHDGNRSYRLVTGDAPPLFSNQEDRDNLGYVLVQMREDGNGLSGNGKGRTLSCTRTSLASWAKQEVPSDELPPAVIEAFERYPAFVPPSAAPAP